jgi:hypothetical protein
VHLTSAQQDRTLRLVTAGVAMRALAHLPPADVFLIEGRLTGRRLPSGSARLWATARDAERVIAGAALVLWAFGRGGRGVTAAANALPAHLMRQDASLVPGVFNYNAHVNLFLLLQTLNARASPRTMRLTLLGDYLLAGTAKVLHGPASWLDGSTVSASWYESDTIVGRRLCRSPAMARLASLSTLAIELGALPAYLCRPSWEKGIGGALVAFHLAIKLTMRISFWPMSSYLPFLFFVSTEEEEEGGPGRLTPKTGCSQVVLAPRAT